MKLERIKNKAPVENDQLTLLRKERKQILAEKSIADIDTDREWQSILEEKLAAVDEKIQQLQSSM